MPINEKQKMLAKLLGKVNADVAMINRNDPTGEMATGEHVAMDAISRREFIQAIENADRLPSMRAVDVASSPENTGQAFSQHLASTTGAPAQVTPSSDIVTLLQSIDGTLQSILQFLITSGTQIEK